MYEIIRPSMPLCVEWTRRLESAEYAELQYKKREKKGAAFGWDVFNQKSLYNAYKRRTDNVGAPRARCSRGCAVLLRV